MTIFPTLFHGLTDLARLPWFTVTADGRLAVKPGASGPAIDMHAHLALGYLRPLAVDLRRATRWTEHYLPGCATIDLDVYVNRNFSERDLLRMKLDLFKSGFGSGGMRATHTAPNLGREMDELHIARGVLLPIDFPKISHNTEAWIDATRGRSDLLCFGSVHPFEPDPEARLDALVARGIKGIKVHPNVQLVPPDHERAMRLYPMFARRKLPVLWHCGPVGIEGEGGRARTQVRRYELPIRENPDGVFILGHSGALQAEEGLALQLRYPNVYLELSSQSLTMVREILRRGDQQRVVFGSDWPFYHQAIPLAKVLAATEGNPALRHKVLWENAAKLLGLPPDGPSA
ncbi:MAG: amidohydrolase family protein [Byssovorax sp.]